MVGADGSAVAVAGVVGVVVAVGAEVVGADAVAVVGMGITRGGMNVVPGMASCTTSSTSASVLLVISVAATAAAAAATSSKRRCTNAGTTKAAVCISGV